MVGTSSNAANWNGQAAGLDRLALELSPNGLLITAHGSNPDSPGTARPLWEQAGKSGTIKVRLSQGTNIKQVQPVGLRGCPNRKSLPVKNGTFKTGVGAFAPVSVVLDTAE